MSVAKQSVRNQLSSGSEHSRVVAQKVHNKSVSRVPPAQQTVLLTIRSQKKILVSNFCGSFRKSTREGPISINDVFSFQDRET